MRLNRYIAQHTELSRRKADAEIAHGHVIVNRQPAHMGMEVSDADTVLVDGKKVMPSNNVSVTITLNKPVGYVCSRDGQGSPTVYDLLPPDQQHLNIAGRLDKDSSGLVIMTDDGQLLNQLTHPSYNKEKVYEVTLDKELTPADLKKLKTGVDIGDTRPSKLDVKSQKSKIKGHSYTVTMTEGRNRQIRRTFEALGHHVTRLHRTHLGPYKLGSLANG